MPTYLDLYNLELPSSSSYTARFIATPSSATPSECLLPPVLSYTPPTPIDYTIPDLTCKFDIDQPVIPPPFFCTPKVGGTAGFAISSSSISSAIASGGISIIRDPSSECDYILDGGFTLVLPETLVSLPCTPIITFSSEMGSSSNSNVVITANSSGTSCSPSLTFDVAVYGIAACESVSYELSFGSLSLDILDRSENSIGNMSLELDTSVDMEDSCAPIFNIDWSTTTMSIDVCSSMSITEVVPALNIPITITDGTGASIGAGQIDLVAAVETTGESCSPSLSWSWISSSASLSLSLGSSASLRVIPLTVCDGETTTTIYVYGPPEE